MDLIFMNNLTGRVITEITDPGRYFYIPKQGDHFVLDKVAYRVVFTEMPNSRNAEAGKTDVTVFCQELNK